jgi:hypothetical protein
MATLILRDGSETLVDDCDLERMSAIPWRSHAEGYVCAWWQGEYTLLHRFVMDAPPEKEVDHKNRDRRDNRRMSGKKADGGGTDGAERKD